MSGPGARVHLTEEENLFGRMAVEQGFLTLEQFLEAVLYRDRKAKSVPLARVLVDKGWLTALQAEEFSRRSKAEAAPPPQEPVGRGPSGTVYRITRPGEDRPFALKVILRNPLNAPFMGAFAAKVRAAAALDHPGFARVVEVEPRREALRIVSEFVPGRPLPEIVRGRGRLSAPTAAHVLHRVATALASAHAKRIVHGNLKPENVMIGEGGQVKLTDAGLARVDPRFLADHVDKAGSIVYSLAPECWKRKAGPGGDLYACGVLWYFMLVGRLPFVGPTFDAIRAQHDAAPPPLPSAEGAAVPRGADDLFARLVAKDPAERGTAAGLARALASWRPSPQADAP
ncbi:MAG TPA: serine/threonine-protein kinase [Planctomycetota bacterium]|nr:serine/threonine-protein kinase [Planctomycetota bacterium]